MPKITPNDLARIRDEMTRTMNLRDGEARARVTVHMGTCGIAAGARKIMKTLMDLVDECEARDVVLTTSGCAGLCSREPMMTVELRGEAPVKYGDLDEATAEEIFRQHVLSGALVEQHAVAVGSERLV